MNSALLKSWRSLIEERPHPRDKATYTLKFDSYPPGGGAMSMNRTRIVCPCDLKLVNA